MKGKSEVTDRLTYLAKEFDVFEAKDEKTPHLVISESLKEKMTELKAAGNNCQLIQTKTDSAVEGHGEVLGIVSTRGNDKGRILKTVSICSDVFASMIGADPSENKMYLQWMLNVFTRFIKEGTEASIAAALRFVLEDLPQANVYLKMFEENKRKKKFIDLCKASFSLKHVPDPTNINQYKSLAQLFDAIDPFIEKEPSAVERTLEKFVSSGQAVIPVKDRKFTLYIPKTTAASVVFNKFANWCTAVEGNGMFKSYTQGNKKPNGKDSDIYIIINNKFFTGESEELFQIHFESKQVKDRKNGNSVNIFENVIQESEGISNFFYEELMAMAKTNKKKIEDNVYLNYLIKFGFSESLFELLDPLTPTIRFMDTEIPKIPDISRFKMLDEFIIINAGLVELHPSVGKLKDLEILVVNKNRIKSLPREIGNLKKLEFINILNNPIKDIPEEISYLDKSNGGSLLRVAVSEDDIGAENYRKLKKLLPSTSINENN